LTERVSRTHADYLAFAASKLFGELCNGLQTLIKIFYFGQQASSFRRDAHSLYPSLKQCKTQLLFRMIQHAADIRLGHIQQARCSADATGLYDGLKYLYVTEPHYYSP